MAFDSDDEKNLMKKTYGSWIILPDHPWKIRWDFYIAFILVYVAIVMPLQIAFVDSKNEPWAW